jgi:Rad3-related DNA helicase
MNKNNILDAWPFTYPPRQIQSKALTWLSEQTAKYLILELPVGTGKSNLGITYAEWLSGRSFILTPQRILQDQYQKSFKDLRNLNLSILYGKTNYKCKSKNVTCEVGSLIKPRCVPCSHAMARASAIGANHTVLNYKLALTSFAFTDLYETRKLMICDECHTLEEHLVDFDALSISAWRCKKYGIRFKRQTEFKPAIEWIRKTYLPKINNAFHKLNDECEYIEDKASSDMSQSDIKKIRELKTLIEHRQEVQVICGRTLDELNDQFVLVHDPVTFQFKRITGEYSFNNIMKTKADKFLFMSSTVLNKQGFCEDLGLPLDETAFLSLESEFPVDNRPILFNPQLKMNTKWIEPANLNKRKNMISTIVDITDQHSGQSGIIHTGNYKISQWLVEELTGNITQTIFHHNPDSDDDRNAIIKALWIKRRMEMSTEWYQRRALISIIQGGGRIVRSETDFGVVYILDGSFAFLYAKAGYMIPKWWKDSYHIIE